MAEGDFRFYDMFLPLAAEEVFGGSLSLSQRMRGMGLEMWRAMNEVLLLACHPRE